MMLKIPFNDKIYLTMKSTTLGHVIQNFPRIFINVNTMKNQVSKNNTPFYISIEVYNPQDFFSVPFCYKTLSNHFHKSVTSIKVTSINLVIKMYQFQKNGLFYT